MNDGFANITIVIKTYFEIGLLSPKPEAIVSLLRPPWIQTGAEGPGRRSSRQIWP